MKVLVTFAIDAEFAPWRKLRKFRRMLLGGARSKDRLPVHRTTIGENDVTVFLTGMGRPNAAMLGQFAKAADAEFAISSGTAGALSPELEVGDVIAPKRVGTFKDSTGIGIRPSLLSFAERRGAKAVDVLLTSDRVIDSAEEKMNLSYFGNAVDMESAYLMEWLATENIPAMTIRTISDDSDRDLPLNFEEVLTPKGRVRPIRLAKELWKRPSKTGDLIRFGKQSKRAAENLAAFLDGFVRFLTPQLLQSETRSAGAE